MQATLLLSSPDSRFSIFLIFYLCFEDFWAAWWQQTYQVKSIVIDIVRILRIT